MTSGIYTVLSLSTILARWIINVSLSFILGHQVVAILIASQVTPPATQIMPISSVVPTTNKNIDISSIMAAHIFGTMPAAVVNVTDAPDTKLNLKLHGIYYTADGTNSFAVIAETEGKHHSYRQGATLAGGVVLHEIHRKEIILARQGRYEILKFTGTTDNPTTTTPSIPKTSVEMSIKKTDTCPIAWQLSTSIAGESTKIIVIITY
ncbi:MAG: type II secretion system protein N [Thiotrichaceae bacterium]